MAAGPRHLGEKFSDYRDRLKREEQIIKDHLRGYIPQRPIGQARLKLKARSAGLSTYIRKLSRTRRIT